MNSARSCALFLSLCSLLGLCSCASPGSLGGEVAPNDHGLEWTLGTWHGTRTDGASGSSEPMVMHVRPMLSGAGQIRELRIEGPSEVYEGFCVQVYDKKRQLWVREYTNAYRGKFTELEGALIPGGDPHSTLWTVTSLNRTRETRLYSEHPTKDSWTRTMTISKDGGETWTTLWIDDLLRERSGG